VLGPDQRLLASPVVSVLSDWSVRGMTRSFCDEGHAGTRRGWTL